MNKDLMTQLGFKEEVKRIGKGNCPICNEKIGTFRNKKSEAEYEISGLCQKCQDKTFGED